MAILADHTQLRVTSRLKNLCAPFVGLGCDDTVYNENRAKWLGTFLARLLCQRNSMAEELLVMSSRCVNPLQA